MHGHHQEWLGSATTHSHGVAAFDFATVSGCDQLVVGPTYARGGILDLLMTDVAELSVILVGLLIIGRSDSEYIVFRNEVELLQSLLRRSILK